MRAIALLSLTLVFLVVACAITPSSRPGADERFEAHVAQVLEEMWREFPEQALHRR